MFNVPGLGVVMGGGDLATAALDAGDKARGINAVLLHFREHDVDDTTSKVLLETLASGGAILSVELSGGSDQAIRLETLADKFCAVTSVTGGAPRY